jgi:hypothetical protein
MTMWLFTAFGFFSIVQKQKGDTLTIRARVRDDLDRLREHYLPSLSSTVAGGGTDYPFRATAGRKAVATAVARIAEDITYSNFKNEVAREIGHERAHVYGSVWGVMRGLEDLKERATGRTGSRRSRWSAGPKRSTRCWCCSLLHQSAAPPGSACSRSTGSLRTYPATRHSYRCRSAAGCSRWRGSRAGTRSPSTAITSAWRCPFVSMPDGARRSDLRECLRSLRVHRVSLALWKDHLAEWKERKEEQVEARGLGTQEQAAALEAVTRRHQGLAGLSQLVADHLVSRETLFRGLGALLEELGAANRLRASGVGQAVDALDRARRILQRLGEEEQARPREPMPDKLRELERRLSETSLRTSAAVRHGVRVASYAQYDGECARFLVLAGLEEGGHPRAPVRPSRAEADLAARLGLGTPEEELLRQARIAAAAASRAREQVLLSWFRRSGWRS